ncbi:hypothetical protein RhiirC2_772215 [Rhizophagus irregularis]|uniref:Myb/SANT-like DNA-binding domain-containing protein n=1 Tax=Rhizophagus irregularis TaxID=588596 RepID=A0A2N1NS31_9GLOM|nr:hypothetical protein RhiirC2_772215 [Rhizophagus irregularis]
MNTTSPRPNAPSDEAEEVRFVFNHIQHDQSQNSIYYFVNFSFPPVLNVPFEAHPQNLQQSLPRQIFQSSSAVRNEAQLIAEFFGTCLEDSVQEVTHGSVSQFLNQYMGPELFAKIRGTSTFNEKDYKKSTKKRNWNPVALGLFFSLLEQHKEVVRQLTSNHGCVKRGLWEYISYTLSQYGHKNFSPPQCVWKWKSIKQDYKKNSEYMYILEVDSILGSNWHKFAVIM